MCEGSVKEMKTSIWFVSSAIGVIVLFCVQNAWDLGLGNVFMFKQSWRKNVNPRESKLKLSSVLLIGNLEILSRTPRPMHVSMVCAP